MIDRPANEPAAIIGMACRYASAPDLRAFWDLLVSARDGVVDYTPGRTPELDSFYAAAGGDLGAPSRRSGFIENIEDFDADFFRISPREAELMDPQQRLLLELAWGALEDAGLAVERIAGPRTGVFIGAWAADYGRQLDATQAVPDVRGAVLNGLFGTSGRLAFAFDFRGPEVSINGACASSLAAIHQGVAALRVGACDVAIVGGGNAIVRPEITQALARAGVLSADGRCKFGDASADGFVRAEGGGILVLKRLSQALADGDRIRAVIRGSAINNSGSSSGFIMRSSEIAQSEVILAALSDAGLTPDDVQYIEAHGTGTATGDQIELSALSATFGRRANRAEPCLVGSVKSNIGHAEAAAGVASVIKTVLALEHRHLPPTLHVSTPNPCVDWTNAGIVLNTNGGRWPNAATRRAGVSSFGIAGANAHLILEEAPAPAPVSCPGQRNAWSLPLSANSPEALRLLASAYADVVEQRSDLADIGFTAATRRSALPYRLAVVGTDATELSARLRAWSEDATTSLVAVDPTGGERIGGPVMVFPGQGSQWPGMGRELMACEPAFSAAMRQCDAAIQAEVGWSISQFIADSGDCESAGIERIQPVLFSLQVALAALWSSWGVHPAVLVGHSMGEVAAAHVAGALSLEDAASIICRRSALMTRFTGQGGMALVELSAEAAAAALRGYEDRLSVAVSNGPRSTVIAGDPHALRSVTERLSDAGVFCRQVAVKVAAHSPQMALIRDELLAGLRGLRPRAGHTPIYSTTLGRLTDGAEFDAQYWVSNLRQPVLFHTALKSLIAEGRQVFIEASPHPILLPAIDESGREAGVEILALASMRREEPEQATMLSAFGCLFVHGMPVDWSRLYPAGRVVDVPRHPWQRRRYWADTAGVAGVPVAAGGHPLLAAPFKTADQSRFWTSRLGVEALPWLKDHIVRGATLLPASAYLEMATIAARQIIGHTNVVVEAVQLKEAIVLSPQHDSVVQLVARLERPGHWSITFHVHDDVADAWSVAGSASVVADDTGAPPSLSPAQIEAFAQGKPAHGMSGDEHAARFKQLGYDFGPDFLNLQWLDIEGHAVRGVARLNDALKTASYGLHPALLDAGFQVLAAGISQRSADPTLLIPRSVGRVRIFPPAAAARAAYVRAELSQGEERGLGGDVRLYAADGTMLAEVLGLAFQAFGAAASASATSLLYRLDWAAADSKPNVAGSPGMSPGSWVVIPDELGAGEAFAAALTLQRHSVEIVECRQLEQRLTADMDFAAGLGVVHFASLDLPADAGSDRIAENAAEIAALATLLNDSGAAALYLVTRGATAVDPAERVSVPQASVWGLGAVIANECPHLACRMIDLARSGGPGEAMVLAGEVLRGDAEPRVALRDGQRRSARLTARDGETASRTTRPLVPGEGAELAITTQGVLDSLAASPIRRRAPSAGDVEIEIQAAGLNFLDVMRAMGLFDPIAGRIPRLGVECAGRIVGIGEGVGDFNVGDAVVALSPAFQEVGTLASHLVTRASLIAKIPDGIGMTEAAALPCVYLTAYFALVEAARMRAGETVLIHSATGGVGLAAIQVARWLGAKIIASAGTEAKRSLLRYLGIAAVLDSRAGEFADRVGELTGGRGADVILNSLSGGAISEGLAALAPYGRFLEIGKRDMWENSRIGLGALLRNRSIFGIDLAAMIEDQPERVGALLRTIMNLVRDGVFAPLPVTVFPASRAAEGFQLMAAARHTGKIVIETAAVEIATETAAMPVRSDGAYLITGGLGALGLVTAEALVDAGARSLVLCGRAVPSERALRVIGKLRAVGANVITSCLDVGDERQLCGLLDEVATTLPPLRGVVHAAGVLDDALVDQLSADRFHSVMRGKVEGARLLDRFTADLKLDFFVLFSSVAAILGSPGQGNYAAANAMLDALAADRSARGLPGLSIAWGPWAEIGLAAAQTNRGARIAERGLASLSPDEGRRLLRSLVDGSRYVAAMRFDPARWVEVAGPSTTALFEKILGQGAHRPRHRTCNRATASSTSRR